MDKNLKNVIHNELSFETAHCVPSKRQQCVSEAGLQVFLCGLGSGKGFYKDFYIINRLPR